MDLKQKVTWNNGQNLIKNDATAQQSVTNRYREFPVPRILIFVGDIGTGIGNNFYRKKVLEPASEKLQKKVLEPASEKFGTGK